jgi:predicted nucleic acid-binding protein
MIVLDTNVLSALMRREVDQTVVTWLDLQPSESVWTTAVTVFEIRFGLELLAPSRRKRQLGDAFSRAVDEDFQGRILPFDHEAALEAASRAAERRAAGRSVDFRDIEIAGIVSARRATLATRNTRHFQDLRIEVVDPWAPR